MSLAQGAYSTDPDQNLLESGAQDVWPTKEINTVKEEVTAGCYCQSEGHGDTYLVLIFLAQGSS